MSQENNRHRRGHRWRRQRVLLFDHQSGTTLQATTLIVFVPITKKKIFLLHFWFFLPTYLSLSVHSFNFLNSLRSFLRSLKQVGFFFGIERTTSLLLLAAVDESTRNVTFYLFTAPNKNCVCIDYRNGSKYVDSCDTKGITQWCKNNKKQ